MAMGAGTQKVGALDNVRHGSLYGAEASG
jgi:hypothetical protein